MRYKIPGLLFLILLAHSLQAQYYFYNDEYYDKPLVFEAGISIGPMNSLTDLGGRIGKGQTGAKDLNIKSTKLYGSAYVSAYYHNILGLRLEGSWGGVKSHDSLLKTVKNSPAIGRYNRNLSFRSQIFEVALTAELHPLEFLPSSAYKEPSAFSPYLIWGIGFFHFNPQARLGNEWVDLKPLHTEGQGFPEYPDRKEYKLNQFNMPYGIGVRYNASNRFNIRLEYLARKLYTDYLDDVHDKYIEPQYFSNHLSGTQLQQALILNNRRRSDAVENQTTARPNGKRGNPFDNDSYFSINIKVGYVFGRQKVNGGNEGGKNGRQKEKARKKQLSCPERF